jgi:hypothetical protein
MNLAGCFLKRLEGGDLDTVYERRAECVGGRSPGGIANEGERLIRNETGHR